MRPLFVLVYNIMLFITKKNGPSVQYMLSNKDVLAIHFKIIISKMKKYFIVIYL